jgi:5-methylthioribose kinase
MVTDEQSYVIDPEFGFYGPIAFDVAKILANLMLTLFATYGLEAVDPSRTSREGQRGGG